MIRPFDWRDVGLLHRLRARGLALDCQQACCHGVHALQHALLGALAPGGLACTLVARPPDGDQPPAVAQFVHHGGETPARLTFFGPPEALDDNNGTALLEALCKAAGGRGARNLVAEVDEHSPAFESLRQAGFAIYARQHILRCEADSPVAPRARRAAAEGAWRAQTAADGPAIHQLYLNLVPVLVQQIEPPPGRGGRGLVHWREGELLGYIDLERGPLGVWAQPHFHPAAEQAHELLQAFLRSLDGGRSRPVYVCVRSYQGWMRAALEALGFKCGASQAVMVKRLAVGVRRPARAPLPALEGTRSEATTPFARAAPRPDRTE